jgi:hypothetical protein
VIVKRIAALAAALALIAGAWLLRDRVIEGDAAGNDGERPSQSATSIVCISELQSVCSTARDELGGDVTWTVADAADTLAQLTAASPSRSVWITLAPFPDMVAFQRDRAGAPALDGTTTTLASSPLALVVRPDRTAELTDACAGDLSWTCVGEQVALRPTFAPIDTAIGAVSVAVAIEQYAGPGVDFGDLGLLTWARALRGAGTSSLSGGTAVATIQTRQTFGVAIGAEAELAPSRAADFDVLYAEPMTTLDVVAFAPDGVDLPAELLTAVRAELTASGWDPPSTSAGGPQAEIVLAAIDYWRRFG